MTMTLYWAPHSRALQALWMLEEAGCAYQRVLIDVRAGAQETPEFAAINPMKKVPALTHQTAKGEARIAESAAICAYVAEQIPDAELAPPLDAPERGRYWQWLFFAPGCIEPAITQKVTNLEIDSGMAGWGHYERVLDVMEGALRDGPWILGDRFTAADVMIGAGLLHGVRRFEVFEARPAFEAYIDRCLTRPALTRALAIDADGV